MEIEGGSMIFLVAFGGGLLAELAKWYSLRESPDFPHYAQRPWYWVVTGLMAAAGGVLAVLYGLDKRSALLVLNIGASAPLVIKSLAQLTPPAPTPGRGYGMEDARRPAPGVLNFIAGR